MKSRQPIMIMTLAAALALGSLLPAGGSGTVYAAAETVADLSDLQTRLAAAIGAREAGFSATYTGGELGKKQLEQMLNDIYETDDYLHYTMKSVKYAYTTGKGPVTVTYTFTYWETPEQSAEVAAKVAEILASIVTPEMNDFQKEKAIHDWIVANVAYDTSLKRHSAYDGLFGSGKTVCQGYALLAYKMLTEAGIENKIVEGKAGGQLHTWNLVKLDGAWYHLDTTWDDPTPDEAGRVEYDYYNLTDAQIKANHKWTKSYPAAETAFDKTLAGKQASDPANAAVYQAIAAPLELHYGEAAYTASTRAELAERIREAMAAQAASLTVRYTAGSKAAVDLQAAIQAFGNISKYSYSKSDYVRTPAGGDVLLTVNLTYSDPVPVTGVALGQTEATIRKGGTLPIAYQVQPPGASVQAVAWTSSAPEVATVNAAGVATGKSAGTATITATTADGGIQASLTLHVYVPVSAVSLSARKLKLAVGEADVALTATVGPAAAADKTVVWSSSNPLVATVDDGGVVHAVAPGMATITAKAADGGKSASAVVTVPVPVTGVALDKTALLLKPKTKANVLAAVAPADATDKGVVWSSSEPLVAAVSPTGVVTAKAPGTAVLTATTKDGGKTAIVIVTVAD